MASNPKTEQVSPSGGFLRKLQHWSGVCFAVFTTLHVGTTISASISPSTYDHVLQLTRGIYRPNILVESALIFAPLCLHMIANSLLFMKGKPATGSVSLSKKLHTWSGYLLGAMVPLHLYGSRFMHPYVAEFAAMNFMAEKEVGQLPALVYFALLLGAGVYHGIYGVNVALGYKLKKPLVMASIVAVLAASYYGVLGVAGFLYPSEMEAVRAKHVQFQH